jgi:flagellar hook-length control protein FliK
MAAVSAPDAAGDREAAPKDSGSAPQHEIPDAQPPGKHTARPGIEGQDAAESTHQPVVSPHESGSVSPAKPLQVPDGDRSVREPASGKRAEAPEVISGPHPGSDSKAVTSPRQAAPSAPVRSPDFIIQLAERIRVEAGDGVDGIRIQLKPANLGRVEINAESGVAGVVARIVTESGAVRQFLEGNIQVLEQALQDQGLRVERLDIVMQQSLDLRQSTGNQHGGPGAGHTTGGSDHHSSHGGPMRDLDAIELDPATLVALGPNSTFHTVA